MSARRTVMNALGASVFVMTSASIDGEAGGGAVAVDDEEESEGTVAT